MAGPLLIPEPTTGRWIFKVGPPCHNGTFWRAWWECRADPGKRIQTLRGQWIYSPDYVTLHALHFEANPSPIWTAKIVPKHNGFHVWRRIRSGVNQTKNQPH